MEKGLKKLRRGELIEIIYQLKKNEQRLQFEISELQCRVREKDLKFERVGSVAEAAVSLSNVFEAAQDAANMYLDEIKKRNEESSEECNKLVLEAQNEAASIISSAKKEAGNILDIAKNDADVILKNALVQKEIILEQCRKLRKEIENFNFKTEKNCENAFGIEEESL